MTRKNQHQLTFFPEHGCYVRTWVGTASRDDVMHYWQALAEDSRWHPDLNALHDARLIEAQRSFSELLQQASAFSNVLPEGTGKIAMLVNDKHRFGLSRQRIAAHGIEEGLALVNYSEADAKAFVGLPAELTMPGD